MTTLRTTNASWLESSLLAQVKNLRHGFSHRQILESEAEQMRLRTRSVKQVHGADHYFLSGALPQPRPEADAISTVLPHTPIGVYTADCVPILLAALDNKNLAQAQAISILAIHAGWRGSAKQIAAHSLQAWQSYWNRLSRQPIHVIAAIGPCIQKNSFEVGEEVIAAFPGIEAAGNAVFFREESGKKKFQLDLVAENKRQLLSIAAHIGLKVEIDALPHCTLANPEQFHSFRRDRQNSGRNLSYISLA